MTPTKTKGIGEKLMVIGVWGSVLDASCMWYMTIKCIKKVARED